MGFVCVGFLVRKKYRLTEEELFEVLREENSPEGWNDLPVFGVFCPKRIKKNEMLTKLRPSLTHH